MTSSEELPTVSVLIALYNKAEYIAATLRSIDRQVTGARFSIEVVVVDDCSTDGSLDIARAFQWANPDVRVRFIELAQNRGPAAAYNAALNASAGHYVTPLDADDLLTRISLLQRFEALQADSHLEWVTANALVIDTDGVLKPGREMASPSSVLMGMPDWPADICIERFIGGDLFVSVQTLMARRSVLLEIGWIEQIICCQDTALVLCLMLGKHKHRHLRDYVAIYRSHISSAPRRSLFGQSIISGQLIRDLHTLEGVVGSRLTDSQTAALRRSIDAVTAHPLRKADESAK